MARPLYLDYFTASKLNNPDFLRKSFITDTSRYRVLNTVTKHLTPYEVIKLLHLMNRKELAYKIIHQVAVYGVSNVRMRGAVFAERKLILTYLEDIGDFCDARIAHTYSFKYKALSDYSKHLESRLHVYTERQNTRIVQVISLVNCLAQAIAFGLMEPEYSMAKLNYGIRQVKLAFPEYNWEKAIQLVLSKVDGYVEPMVSISELAIATDTP